MIKLFKLFKNMIWKFISFFPCLNFKIHKLQNRRTFYKLINNHRILTPEQKSKIKNFYGKYRKGSTIYSAFYLEKTGKFDHLFLPHDLYYEEIDAFFNDKLKAVELDDKTLYPKLLKMPFGKHTNRICYFINGIWFSADWNVIDINRALSNIKQVKEIFIKVAVDSFGGKGVKVFKTINLDREKLMSIVREMDCNNLVLEEPIHQCVELSKLNNSSINTIRIISFMDETGFIKIYSSILRMGRENCRVDNASSGGIFCGIEQNGNLKSEAYNNIGVKYNKKHPDSNQNFSEIRIPNFSQILDLVKKLHVQLPFFRLLSWDFAVDNNSIPILVEVNMRRGSLIMHQLANGPLFGPDTEKILKEVYKGTKFPLHYKLPW